MQAGKNRQPKKNKQRAENQTTLTLSLDEDLDKAIRERAKSLKLSRSAYLRLLAQQDIEGNAILSPSRLKNQL